MFDRSAGIWRARRFFLGSSFASCLILTTAIPSDAAVHPVSVHRNLLTFARANPTDGSDPLFDNEEIQSNAGGAFSEQAFSSVEDGPNSVEGFAAQSTSIEDDFVVGSGSYHSGAIIDFEEYDFGQGLGLSNLSYQFDVDAPTHYELIGQLAASGSGSTHFELLGPNGPLLAWSIHEDEIDLSDSGILEPGAHRLTLQCIGYGEAFGGSFTPGTGRFAIELGFGETSSVPPAEAALHTVSVSPNPARDRATIDLRSIPFVVSEIEVLSVTGQVVRRLQPDGPTADWDTRDEFGSPVSPGIYFFRAGRGVTGRIVVLR